MAVANRFKVSDLSELTRQAPSKRKMLFGTLRDLVLHIIPWLWLFEAFKTTSNVLWDPLSILSLELFGGHKPKQKSRECMH